MADEPYFRPGKYETPADPPTQFCPVKPAGPDPVSPSPDPEGSETRRHVQLFGLDVGSGLFKPFIWKDGKLVVDTEIGDITVITPVNTYGEAPLVAQGTDTTVVSYVVPTGKTFYLRHGSASGENLARFWLEINGVKQDTRRSHFGGYNVDFFFEASGTERGVPATATQVVRIRVRHEHNTPGDFDGKLYGVLA